MPPPTIDSAKERLRRAGIEQQFDQAFRAIMQRIFAGGLVLFAGVWAFLGVRQVYENLASRSVLGSITNWTIVEHHGRRGSHSFMPVVTFQYEVAGTRYESARLSSLGFDAQDTREEAEAVARQYGIHEVVFVYVPPGRPGAGFLRLKWNWYPWLYTVFLLWFARFMYTLPDRARQTARRARGR